MKAKQINDNPKMFAVIFETGDEVVEGLVRFARENRLSASQVTAIGAFSEVTLGYFNLEKKDYKKIPVIDQVEVLSLIGDIALKNGEPTLHAHVVGGKSDASTLGGHLISGKVRPTLEVIITESPKHLHKTIDVETGLALINPDK